MNGSESVAYYKPWELFSAAGLLCFCYMAAALSLKLRKWLRGSRSGHAEKTGHWPRIAWIWTVETFLQRQLYALSKTRWAVHFALFWGFIGLAYPSLVRIVLGFMPFEIGAGLNRYLFFGEGRAFVKLWSECFGLLFLAGLACAAARRYLSRPDQIITEQKDSVLLLVLLWLTLSGFFLEWLHASVYPSQVLPGTFMAWLPGMAFSPERARPVLTFLWTLHGLSGLSLMLYLPHSKLMHSVLAPFVIALNAAQEHEREDVYWPDINQHREI